MSGKVWLMKSGEEVEMEVEEEEEEEVRITKRRV